MTAVVLLARALLCGEVAAAAARGPAQPSCGEFSLGDGSRALVQPGGGPDTLRIRVVPKAGGDFRDDLPSALPSLNGSSSSCASKMSPGQPFTSGNVRATVRSSWAANSTLFKGSRVPPDPFAPRRMPLGSSPDIQSAIGNANAFVPRGPLARP